MLKQLAGKKTEKVMVHLNCWSFPGKLLHVVEGDFHTVSAEKTIQELQRAH